MYRIHITCIIHVSETRKINIKSSSLNYVEYKNIWNFWWMTSFFYLKWSHIQLTHYTRNKICVLALFAFKFMQRNVDMHDSVLVYIFLSSSTSWNLLYQSQFHSLENYSSFYHWLITNFRWDTMNVCFKKTNKEGKTFHFKWV